MYKIKQTHEDFKVTEITNVQAKDSGRYAYFWLTKRDYTTVRAIEAIAQALGIKPKDIGFAGTKDKKAVTKQLISIKNSNKNIIEKIRLKDIKLEFYGYGDEPISLGCLEGNEFEIIVEGNSDKLETFDGIFPNYFGEQRFSVNNKDVGKAIIKDDLKKAVELILDNDGDLEKDVMERLKKDPNDYVNALNKINKKILKMYVHSYQSYLFNEMLDDIVNHSIKINANIKSNETMKNIKNSLNEKIDYNKENNENGKTEKNNSDNSKIGSRSLNEKSNKNIKIKQDENLINDKKSIDEDSTKSFKLNNENGTIEIQSLNDKTIDENLINDNKSIDDNFNENSIKTIKLPLIGFGTEVEQKEIKKLVDPLMKKENITFRDFIIRKIPELSSEGDYRKAFVEAKDFSYEKDGKKVRLRFKLPKGSYATVLVDCLFG